MKQLKPIEQESNIDFYKGILKRLIKNWLLFVFSIATSLVIGHYFFKSSNHSYKNNLLILIQESNERRGGGQNSSDLQQLEMFNVQSTLVDELGIISSYPVIYETVKQLKLEVSYYINKGIVSPEIYKESPIQVMFSIENPQPVDVFFELSNITKDGYKLTANQETGFYLYNYLSDTILGYVDKLKISKKCAFGEEVEIGGGKFKIVLNEKFHPDYYKDSKLLFKFNNIKILTYGFQGDLSVERLSNQSSLVSVSIKGPHPGLVTDFLNTLSSVYLNRNLQKKNRIADKTINFIDAQIDGIADSLGLTANQLKDFRVKNNVMDINFLSQNVYQQMQVLEDQRAALLVASKYYDYIKEYFENNKDLTDLMAPSAMGVNDPQLQSLITQLTQKNSERQFQLDSKSDRNPRIPVLNAEINNLKKTILENIDYIVSTSAITINDINDRIAVLKRQVNRLPGIEKELRNIEREFHVNDAIYTFLLSTRAEAEIARASNSPDYEIIDPARLSSAKMVSPKKNMIYFTAFFFGLFAPIGLIMMMSMFKNSIDDKREIDKLSHYPLIGSIAHNDKKSYIPMYDFPKSLIAESFRSVRTSMQFFQKGKSKQRILVTSSTSGDGKSFIAINLAAAYSYSGKRTLLIEFDLRNPRLANYFGIQQTKGLSSYLINDAKLEDIILKTGIKNFDVICAGEIPPNPVELVASENARNIIDIVQNLYDYVVFDTPPIGVVTDSYLLMDQSDVNLFVVRLNYTNKKFFSSLIKDLELKEISNIALLVNDDAEKANSVYYSDPIKMPYWKAKMRTLKSLFKIGRNKEDA